MDSSRGVILLKACRDEPLSEQMRMLKPNRSCTGTQIYLNSSGEFVYLEAAPREAQQHSKYVMFDRHGVPVALWKVVGVYPNLNACMDGAAEIMRSSYSRGEPMNDPVLVEELNRMSISARTSVNDTGFVASGTACSNELVGALSHLSLRAGTHSASFPACGPPSGLSTSSTCTSTDGASSVASDSNFLSNSQLPNSNFSATSVTNSTCFTTVHRVSFPMPGHNTHPSSDVPHTASSTSSFPAFDDCGLPSDPTFLFPDLFNVPNEPNMPCVPSSRQ